MLSQCSFNRKFVTAKCLTLLQQEEAHFITNNKMNQTKSETKNLDLLEPVEYKKTLQTVQIFHDSVNLKQIAISWIVTTAIHMRKARTLRSVLLFHAKYLRRIAGKQYSFLLSLSAFYSRDFKFWFILFWTHETIVESRCLAHSRYNFVVKRLLSHTQDARL